MRFEITGFLMSNCGYSMCVRERERERERKCSIPICDSATWTEVELHELVLEAMTSKLEL